MTALRTLFGGTFDPVHYGHLLTVEKLAQQIGLRQVTILPNSVPPHRPKPKASVTQRVAMLKLAIANRPLFTLDTRELTQSSSSRTVETLKQLRKEHGKTQSIAFIIGQDSLLSLHKWYHWEILLDLCHLLVCQRPNYTSELYTPELKYLLIQRQTYDVIALYQQSAGLIWLADTPLMPISATTIRYCYRNNIPCDHLLPTAVNNYINHHGLYRS